MAAAEERRRHHPQHWALAAAALIADRTNIDPPTVRQLRARFTEEQLRQLTELLESGWQGTWEQLAAVVTA